MSEIRLMFRTLAMDHLRSAVAHLGDINLLRRLAVKVLRCQILRLESTGRRLFLHVCFLSRLHGSLHPDHGLDGLEGLDHILFVEVRGADGRADVFSDVGGVALGRAVVGEYLQGATAVPPQGQGVRAGGGLK